VVHQPDLPAALAALIEAAIRGDPQTPLRRVSRSQRHLAQALVSRGFRVSQKLVGLLLRQLGCSCQANRKTRDGTSHPDRDAHLIAMPSSATSTRSEVAPIRWTVWRPG
jgi:Rhodopirellula transposase DDE domain